VYATDAPAARSARRPSVERLHFGEEIERRAADAKLILETAAKHGVPVEMLWKPSGTPLTSSIGHESGNPKSKIGKRD
jgi:hypothetical protein